MADIFSYSYAEKGAYFVCFALPDTTICIDTITGRWHERKSTIPVSKFEKGVVRSRVNSVLTAYGRLIVGDSIDGRVGEMSTDIFTEYDEIIFRRFATQPFQNNMKAIFVPILELTVESGVGLNNEVDPPVVRLEVSKDGGQTYGFDRSRSMGKIGEYGRRVIWRRNGRFSRFSIFRFTMTEPVKPVMIQLTASIVGGAY